MLIADGEGNDIGYVTSPWWSPELETNIALAWVPWSSSEIGTKLLVRLPDEYATNLVVNLLKAKLLRFHLENLSIPINVKLKLQRVKISLNRKIYKAGIIC